ncbi:MATE family efflux transporter [Maricaulis sp. W15]|uniref:MATE family efflux transporter n=1 Tax=Maricaulis sp. W15 TaxID=1772333 RepID=UPI000948C5E7|nr:MATE family efflux transporter [Maricaulis sp. W15]OLF73080.1 MATE family efflux transporter [Maricaulis sp. W15]
MAGRAAHDMTEGPVFGHILRMIMPMSFGILAMMLVGIVDTYWVGTLGTAEQAAVQMSFPVTMLVMSVAIGLGAGAVSAVSRAAGRKDGTSTIARIATDAMTLALISVGSVSMLGVIFVEPIFRQLGASETMLPHVVDYMSVWFAGIVLIVGPMVASNILRALGNAVIPSLMMIAAAFVNLILDPIFILDDVFGIIPGLGWGVSGAALATVAANAVTFAMVAWYLAVKEKLIDVKPEGFGEVWHHWLDIARVGLPACLSNVFNPLAMTIAMSGLAMARFGDSAVGGLGVAGRIEAFAIVPLFALSACIGAVTGQNGGADRLDRVREAFRSSFIFCIGWSLGIAAILWVTAPWLAAAFLPSEAGQSTAIAYWRIVPLTIAGYGITIAASAGFNGLGRPAHGMVITASRALGMMIPAVIIGAYWLDAPVGVIWGVAFANIVAGLATALFVLTRAPMTAKHGRQRKRSAPPAAEPVADPVAAQDTP